MGEIACRCKNGKYQSAVRYDLESIGFFGKDVSSCYVENRKSIKYSEFYE